MTGERERQPPRAPLPALPGVATTQMLLQRARAGDDGAIEDLCRRLLPRLQRWATGRLPARARSVVDTGDLVQEVVLGALKNVERIDNVHEGALTSYLRTALGNRIRDELRRMRAVPPEGELDPLAASPAPSPLEELIGQDAFHRYEEALARLSPRDREAIVQRMELGLSHAELAEALGLHGPDAARKVVSRALLRLAHEMERGIDPEERST